MKIVPSFSYDSLILPHQGFFRFHTWLDDADDGPMMWPSSSSSPSSLLRHMKNFLAKEDKLAISCSFGTHVGLMHLPRSRPRRSSHSGDNFGDVMTYVAGSFSVLQQDARSVEAFLWGILPGSTFGAVSAHLGSSTHVAGTRRARRPPSFTSCHCQFHFLTQFFFLC